MKKKEIQDLRGKTQAELKKKAEDKRLELSKIVANLKASKEKNLKKAKNLRRELAQILTVLREKEILERDEL